MSDSPLVTPTVLGRPRHSLTTEMTERPPIVRSHSTGELRGTPRYEEFHLPHALSRRRGSIGDPQHIQMVRFRWSPTDTSTERPEIVSTPVRAVRRQSIGETTPRSAASTLGQRRHSVGEFERIEMKTFRKQREPHIEQYGRNPMGWPTYTQDIYEDLPHLEKSGFIIDMKNGRIGRGFYGDVYKGIYGENAEHCRDKDGQPLRNVVKGMPFAVKFVDFNRDRDAQAKRETYENEKYIMTIANHRNITPIRMAINMGKPEVFSYTKLIPQIYAYKRGTFGLQFIQHERVYLIMDWAQHGSLFAYMQNRYLQPSERIKLVRDLFAGLKYLHDQLNIVHGDIHVGNVLIFEEDFDVVAKWTDFGLAFVNKKGKYEYVSDVRRGQVDLIFQKRVQSDCEKFETIVVQIWSGLQKDGLTEDMIYTCERHMELIPLLRRVKNLDQVLQTLPDVVGYEERFV